MNNQHSGGAILDQQVYIRDHLGTPTQRQETLGQVGGGQASLTTLYGYAKLAERTSASPNDSQTTYCYNRVGNRVRPTAGCPQPYPLSYDKADRIVPSGRTTSAVNAPGAVTTTGTAESFGYDQAHRLISAKVNGVTTTDAYNGDGVRTS